MCVQHSRLAKILRLRAACVQGLDDVRWEQQRAGGSVSLAGPLGLVPRSPESCGGGGCGAGGSCDVTSVF